MENPFSKFILLFKDYGFNKIGINLQLQNIIFFLQVDSSAIKSLLQSHMEIKKSRSKSNMENHFSKFIFLYLKSIFQLNRNILYLLHLIFLIPLKYVHKQQSSYSSFHIHKKLPKITMSKPSTPVLINGVKPLRANWRIRVKVLHCWKQNTPYGGDTLECILADETVNIVYSLCL